MQVVVFTRAVGPLAVLLAALLASDGCKMQAGDNDGVPEAGATPAPNAHVRSVHASDGDVAGLVRTERAHAMADGRQLVVYVGAVWCEPCQRFHHAVERGELDGTFPKLTLLEFDDDKDHERLTQAGYMSKYIPLFALPKEDGTASGKQVEGGVKGDGAVGVVTAKLKGLLE